MYVTEVGKSKDYKVMIRTVKSLQEPASYF